MNKTTLTNDSEFLTLDEVINNSKTVITPNIAQITTDWVQSLNDITANDLLPVFIRLTETHKDIPFSYLDFYLSAVYLDTSRELVESLFYKFIAHLQKHKKVSTILAKNSAYSYDQFKFV
jgi:hypothetical protein